MNTFWSIVLIFCGILILIITISDRKKIELTTSHVMHLGGYIGGIIFILIGLIKLFHSAN